MKTYLKNTCWRTNMDGQNFRVKIVMELKIYDEYDNSSNIANKTLWTCNRFQEGWSISIYGLAFSFFSKNTSPLTIKKSWGKNWQEKGILYQLLVCSIFIWIQIAFTDDPLTWQHILPAVPSLPSVRVGVRRRQLHRLRPRAKRRRLP